MERLINLSEYPVKPVLKLLVADKTTKQNIVFATGSYSHLGARYREESHIDEDLLFGMDAMLIQPRVLKNAAEQADRTKKKAEVMTPAWIVNKMNNHCDEEWFGYPNAFNREDGERWVTREEPVAFPKGKSWKKYVDSMRLEITCGEAPYLVSRYDTTTGESIPVKDRIGILDRKLRVVGENTTTKKEWYEAAIRAFQSVYGYEYQGDNLLIGRINLLITFVDYMQDRWDERPTEAELKKIANIIAWNIWQMDGLTGTVPLGEPIVQFEQLGLSFDEETEENGKERSEPCKIYDWKANKSVTYNSIKGER